MSVTSGTESTIHEVDLNQSNVPVPEFNGIAITVFTTIGLSWFIIGRKRRNSFK
jgi:hypothetical protein